ncbi:hypothetical protein [Micromonospora sp. NPDC048839]|uniref:hypothetical protein n=1 Tax=Micromonospora sp. NPDC048839 TaxID=3155641 RepID=UPI0033C40D51
MNGHHDAETTASGHDKVLARCRHQWETAGLSPAAINDMLDELSTHLTQAATRGRTAEDVVGPDLGTFAREWARARTPRPTRWLRLAVNAITVLMLLSLVRHLILRDATLEITPGYIVFAVSLLVILIGWPKRSGEPSYGQFAAASAVGLALAVLVDLVLLPDRTVFILPLWATATVAALTLAFAYWENRDRSAS